MQVNSRAGVVAVHETQTVSAKTIRQQPVREQGNRVDRFEATVNDVPISRAGTVRQAMVTSELKVKQGESNACGPIALWLALGQFGRATQQWEQLDADIRPWGLGSSPGVLAEAARERGLQAQVYNHGTFFDLERETQAGRGVLVMSDVGGYDVPGGTMRPGDGGDFGSHWMRVTRAWEDSMGRRWVEYENPWGAREVLRFEQFDSLWRDQRLGGIPTGYDRAFVLIDRLTSKPLPTTTADDVQALMATTDGAQTLARGLAALSSGKFVTGLCRLAGGGTTLFFGAVGSALAVPGLLLQRGGDALLDVAKQGLEQGGLAALGGALAGGAGLLVRGVGMIASSVGNAVGFIGQAVGAMVQGSLSSLGTPFR
jgi:hypothetical protein